MERFPDASKNSYRKLPRSGILLIGFELGRRQVADCQVQPLLVVDLFEKLADRSTSLGQIPDIYSLRRTSSYPSKKLIYIPNGGEGNSA
jgi:hypothetical protein